MSEKVQQAANARAGGRVTKLRMWYRGGGGGCRDKEGGEHKCGSERRDVTERGMRMGGQEGGEGRVVTTDVLEERRIRERRGGPSVGHIDCTSILSVCNEI